MVPSQNEDSTHNRYSITYDDIFGVAPVPKQAAGSETAQVVSGVKEKTKNPRTAVMAEREGKWKGG